MNPAELAATAGLAAAIIAVFGLIATGIFRIGKLTEATNRLSQSTQLIHDRLDRHEVRNEEQLTQAETRNEERQDQTEARINERLTQNEALNEERFRRLEDMIRSNEELIRHNEELIRSESERTRGQIRVLQQVIMTHFHDTDGTVMFRVPPTESDD